MTRKQTGLSVRELQTDIRKRAIEKGQAFLDVRCVIAGAREGRHKGGNGLLVIGRFPFVGFRIEHSLQESSAERQVEFRTCRGPCTE